MVKLSAGEKKRQHIIRICKKLFYENGYANTTYEDICKEADIPPGSITYHFEGKWGIAAAIQGEFEMQNKTYIEKMCANRSYSKTQLMAIEIFHLWSHYFEDANLLRFVSDLSAESIPQQAVFEPIRYFYQCVIDDLGITGIGENEMKFIVGSQIGMSDMMFMRVRDEIDTLTYEEVARFCVRFFLRQLGVADSQSAEIIAEGSTIFHTLPIDNRYYRDFAYDEKYLTVLPAE